MNSMHMKIVHFNSKSILPAGIISFIILLVNIGKTKSEAAISKAKNISMKNKVL